MGNNTRASGNASTAMGNNTVATGIFSTAMGNTTNAEGNNSTATVNNTTAIGIASTAMGENTVASSDRSTAIGFGTTASGSNSTAMGESTNAIGTSSTARGNNTTASGNISTAIGNTTTASGEASTAMGNQTTALSHAETSIGTFNTTYTPFSTFAFNAADRLFTIGNGSALGSESNALIIYKDGRMNINDAYTMPNVAGTANQILQTDAGGNVSWFTIPALNTLYAADDALTSNRIVDHQNFSLNFQTTITNGFSVDGTTFSVDGANNRVGI